MSERTMRVLQGWLNLSEQERSEVAAEIERMRRLVERKQLDETAERLRVNAGPVKMPCPCCGRG